MYEAVRTDENSDMKSHDAITHAWTNELLLITLRMKGVLQVYNPG